MPDAHSLEAYVVTYNRPEHVRQTIGSFRANGGAGVKLTVFDNSPSPQVLEGVDAYYHFPFNPSLTRVWNWAIGMCRTPWVLISNDDVEYQPGFMEALKRDQHFVTAKLHNRFIAFLLHRSLVRDIGWFDERLTTIYWEDTDYVRRVHRAGLPWCSDCLISPYFKSIRPEPGHACYQEWYDRRAKALDERHRGNLALYEDKWGDHDNNFPPVSPNASRWPEPNWYPCAELPA